MYELAKVTLENEMDLVLAHKRSMKLAEIAGLSLPAQTTFATAVSEVARNTIDNGKNGCLTLGISDERKRSIVASIKDEHLNNEGSRGGLEYAKRLLQRLNIFTEEKDSTIDLYYYVPQGDKIDIRKLDQWRNNFRNEPPISPYDEIKRKNEQLLELTEKITEREENYRVLTDTLPLMMFSIDEKGQLSYVNKWMMDYFGTTLEVLKSRPYTDHVHKNDLPSEEAFREMTGRKEPIKTEWRIKNSKGDYIWHLVSIIPIFTGEQSLNWIGFLVDIQAQKLFEKALTDNRELVEIQEQLQYNIKELNRSNQELQQFAYVASHDLQEPLRKVIFYSDYFQSRYADQLDGKSADYLKGMIDASQRMRLLISDLLAFSQVDKMQLEIVSVDLLQTVKDAVSDYEVMIREKNATVDIGLLPVIEGDETMLRRLLENLLSNALKYSQEKLAPHISISSKAEGDMVQIAFSDNGIGFEEQYLPKMFTLFQRLHGRGQFAGTGLGLAICRKIVELHQGTITARSELDKGSCFYISLPVKQKS